MVKGVWYGGTGGGSSAWESVNPFYTYVNKAKTYGPKGKGYNNNKLAKSLTNIQVGDVLRVEETERKMFISTAHMSHRLRTGRPLLHSTI